MRRAHRRTDKRRITLPLIAGAAVLGLSGIGATGAVAAQQPGPAMGDRIERVSPGAGAGTRTDASAQRHATLDEARRLGRMEKISSFTVAFPTAPYRTTNVGRAVQLINGSLVMPGETWSFNNTVGERTAEHGFVDGIMIDAGRYVKAPGGGVSAVATTMYNAAFFAGVQPVEHGAHSFYIERYPEGREATVAWGTLDLRWKNDTGHPLYIEARSTDKSVTITMLGTKKYDEIRSAKGPRTNVVPPAKVTATGPDCEAQTPLEGFDVTVDRIFVQNGQEVRRETYPTHYTPRDEVVCVPQSPSPTPGTPTPAAAQPATPGTAPHTPAPAPTAPAPTAPAHRG